MRQPLRNIEGVKRVTVKVSKKGRVSLSIAYTDAGVLVLGVRQTISPEFEAGVLKSVTLRGQACATLASAKFKEVQTLLGEKYGDPITQKEVTEDRQFVGARSTFSATPTRVMLRYELGDAPSYVTPSGGKFGRALAMIANDAADSEVAECPNDAGIKATLEISYMSNAVAAQADAERRAKEAADRLKEKAKL